MNQSRLGKSAVDSAIYSVLLGQLTDAAQLAGYARGSIPKHIIRRCEDRVFEFILGVGYVERVGLAAKK